MDSKHIFELRNQAKSLFGSEKLNILNKARESAKALYREIPNDEWVQKAFAWVLIDLCKYHLENNNINQAEIHFQELGAIDFNFYDDIIPNQINFLRPKINIVYSEIQKAEEGKYSWSVKTLITEYKYVPLVVEKSDKNNWEILENIFAVVDYINIEKNIIHAITINNEEVFFPQTKNELQIGDFIIAKKYSKKSKPKQK